MTLDLYATTYYAHYYMPYTCNDVSGRVDDHEQVNKKES
jgi:hypothetical protein